MIAVTQPNAQPALAFGPNYHEVLTLRSGEQVQLRLLRPEDRELLASGFAALSDETRYLRFLVPKMKLTEAELRYLCETDGVRHVAIAAGTLPANPHAPHEGVVGLGIARLIVLTDEPGIAEAAVVVRDEWQGRGLGGALFQRVLAAARERDVTHVRCLVLAHNAGMRELIASTAPEYVVDSGGGVMSILFPIYENHDAAVVLQRAQRNAQHLPQRDEQRRDANAQHVGAPNATERTVHPTDTRVNAGAGATPPEQRGVAAVSLPPPPQRDRSAVEEATAQLARAAAIAADQARAALAKLATLPALPTLPTAERKTRIPAAAPSAATDAAAQPATAATPHEQPPFPAYTVHSADADLPAPTTSVAGAAVDAPQAQHPIEVALRALFAKLAEATARLRSNDSTAAPSAPLTSDGDSPPASNHDTTAGTAAPPASDDAPTAPSASDDAPAAPPTLPPTAPTGKTG